jgi:hypothetical protein
MAGVLPQISATNPATTVEAAFAGSSRRMSLVGVGRY